MSAQLFQDILAVGGMLVLRIGLPLVIILGAGYLIRRWLEPAAAREQFEGMVRTQQENAAKENTPQPVEAAAEDRR